jgi:hypothetical protein
MIMKPLALAGFSFFIGPMALKANVFVKHSCFSYLPELRAILPLAASVQEFSAFFLSHKRISYWSGINWLPPAFPTFGFCILFRSSKLGILRGVVWGRCIFGMELV